MKRRILFLSAVAVALAASYFSFPAGEGTGWRTSTEDTSGDSLAPQVSVAVPLGSEDSAGDPDEERDETWERRAATEGFSQEIRRDQEPHEHVIRAWQGVVSPALRELGDIQQRDGGVDRFSLPLFDGEEIVVTVRQFSAMGASAGVFTGEVAGEPGSLVSLAYVGAAESGSIHLPSRDQVFEIRAGPEQTIILSEIDAHALGECGLHAEPSMEMQKPEPIPE